MVWFSYLGSDWLSVIYRHRKRFWVKTNPENEMMIALDTVPFKMITPPSHIGDCLLEDISISTQKKDTFSESICSCGAYQIKKQGGWAF